MNLLIGTTAGAFSLDDPATPIISGTRINHLFRDADGWWALDGKGRVHHDDNVVTTAPGDVALNCIQPADEIVWVGATEGRLYRVAGSGLVPDDLFADAPGRDEWYTPWGGPPDIRSMALDVSGSLFINIHVGGILRYDDEKLSPTIDQDADVHQVITHPSRSELVLAACARGLARSTDGHDFNIANDGLHASYCRAVAVVGTTVLVSASTGPRTSQGRIYRSDLECGPFQPCSEGLPEWFEGNLNTHCLAAVDGSVHAGFGDKVWQSEDEGSSWTEVASGLPNVTCLA